MDVSAVLAKATCCFTAGHLCHDSNAVMNAWKNLGNTDPSVEVWSDTDTDMHSRLEKVCTEQQASLRGWTLHHIASTQGTISWGMSLKNAHCYENILKNISIYITVLSIILIINWRSLWHSPVPLKSIIEETANKKWRNSNVRNNYVKLTVPH